MKLEDWMICLVQWMFQTQYVVKQFIKRNLDKFQGIPSCHTLKSNLKIPLNILKIRMSTFNKMLEVLL